MKATFKNICVTLVLLIAVMAVLVTLDNNGVVTSASTKTCVRVKVVDLVGNPVHNAEVKLNGEVFYTDNKGMSPLIELANVRNSYSAEITDWFTQDIVVTGDGYLPSVLFNCVVYSEQTRKVTVRIYPRDSSDLDFVSYVESPPDDYIDRLLQNCDK